MNNQIASSNCLLILFSYQLRMADNDEDKFTLFLLDMILPKNMNRTLREIILANKKNKDGTALEWVSKDRYKIMCG